MDVLNNCGWCRGTGGGRDRSGVVDDEGNGGNGERRQLGRWDRVRGYWGGGWGCVAGKGGRSSCGCR